MTLNATTSSPQPGKHAKSQKLSRMRARASELDGRASWEAATELWLEILQLDRQSLGDEHLHTLSDMNALARTYTESGQLEKAESVYLDVVSARQRLLGEEHPDTLKSMQGHAWALMKLGKMKEAEDILVQVVARQKKVLGQDDSETLMSMHNLSWAYLRNEKLEEAEALSTQVVESRRRLLGNEHSDTLDIMHNLATIYRQQNRLEKTAELYHQIVKASECAHGTQHIDTLHSMRCLAAAYLAQGQLKEAEALYGRIASAQKEVLGEEHPDTLDSINRLASTMYKQGRLKEAETLFLQVLAARDRVLGEDNPSTLKSVHSLASTYRRQGRFKEAEELYRRAVSGRKSVLGDSHHDTIASLESLAGTYRKQAKWGDAEKSELELLEIRKKLLGEEHPSTLGSMRTLARIYMHQKRRKEAEKYEMLIVEKARAKFSEAPSVAPCAPSSPSDQPKSVSANKFGASLISEYVLPPGPMFPQDSASANTAINANNASLVQIPSPPAKQTIDPKVPESPASDGSGSGPPSPAHYDAYSTIDHVIRQLHICTLSFQYPDDLDFEAAPPGSQPVPRLAYTSKNRLFLEQIRKLESLQETLDGIDSLGDRDVRQARRETGALVQRALADLEWAQAIVWDKLSEGATSNNSTDDSRESDTSSIGASESSGQCISRKTPVEDVFDHLLKHKCLDYSSKIDSSQCSTAPLAGGNFGDVWRGVLTDGTQVAIKCLRLHTDTESSVKIVKRGARELYNWSKTRHENVLKLIGIAMFRDQLAMISPWMGNGTLSSYVRENPGVNRWALCLQVAEGLAYMHRIKMVHGDLKGTNVFVSDEGVVKLGDFGHSILEHHSLSFSATTNFGGGTARWMAPELLMTEDEEGPTDRTMPADVYALGMTILEVVTGKQPYAEIKNPLLVMRHAAQGIHPQRPKGMSVSTQHGDARWNMLLSCWNTDAKCRPKAERVRDTVFGLL